MEFILIYSVLTFSIMLFIFIGKIHVSTVSMAAVMSIGITTQGVLYNFFGSHFFYSIAGRVVSIIDISLWSSFIFSFLLAYFNKKFKELHYANPINRFGIGTWVAGTSICGILIDKQFNEWSIIVKFILYFNLILWAFYILICVRALADVYKKGLTKNVHGVLLLTTVGTQSIVLLASAVYKGIPVPFALFFTSIGACFYLISALMILKRYSVFGTWSIQMDWNNTNCILHGALSITGLSCIVSHLLTQHSVMIIWACAFFVFLIVESIELFRLYSRIKHLGWKQAFAVYNVSQWSRVFTFAMFYTFTYLSNPNSYFAVMKHFITTFGIWLILVLAFFEIVLSVISLIENYPRKVKIKTSSNGIDSSF